MNSEEIPEGMWLASFFISRLPAPPQQLGMEILASPPRIGEYVTFYEETPRGEATSTFTIVKQVGYSLPQRFVIIEVALLDEPPPWEGSTLPERPPDASQ